MSTIEADVSNISYKVEGISVVTASIDAATRPTAPCAASKPQQHYPSQTLLLAHLLRIDTIDVVDACVGRL